MADFARGQRLRELREQRHLSQEDAAHEISVSTKTIRAWEHGGKIKWDNAKRAATFYGVDAESLVTRDGDVPDGPLPDESQLDRIEAKVDYLIASLAPAEPEPVVREFETTSREAPPAGEQKAPSKRSKQATPPRSGSRS